MAPHDPQKEFTLHRQATHLHDDFLKSIEALARYRHPIPFLIYDICIQLKQLQSIEWSSNVSLNLRAFARLEGLQKLRNTQPEYMQSHFNDILNTLAKGGKKALTFKRKESLATIRALMKATEKEFNKTLY